MRTLALIFFLLPASAFAACSGEHVVTEGATLEARTKNGRPIITMQGAGGITIQHRGDQSGAFTVTRECDPERADRLRAELERILAHEDAFTR